jgi:SAM-dependent methyltransferase
MDATQWDERYRSAELVWGTEPNRFVRQMCERLPIGTAIDLACGEGRNAIWLARLGWRVLGVDFSSAAIDRARELSQQLDEDERVRVSWRVEDVTATPPRAASFELAVISYVHLTAAQNRALISDGARALKPGGHLVVVGHDRRNLHEGVGGPQDADRLYVPEDIALQLVDEGLELDIAETVQRPTSEGIALDTVVRARRPSDS